MIPNFLNIFRPPWVDKIKDTQESRKYAKKQNELDQQQLNTFDPSDGSYVIDGQYVNNALYNASFLGSSKSTFLINTYRDMVRNADVEYAVDDIVNSMITSDSEEYVVKLNLGKTDLSEDIKEKIANEFQYLLDLLNFNKSAYDKVKQWYVDGQQYFQIIVDNKNPKNGIQRLIWLDPRSIRKIKAVYRKKFNGKETNEIDRIEEYYHFQSGWLNHGYTDPNISQNVPEMRATGVQGFGSPVNLGILLGYSVAENAILKLPMDAVAFVHSGLISQTGEFIYSFLEEARKPLNVLNATEDAALIYRLTRSTEKRKYIIDVGGQTKKEAERTLETQIARFKSKSIYDSSDGTIKRTDEKGRVIGHAHDMGMYEDFFLPRDDEGRGSDIEVLPAGSNLGEMDDILYFKRNLFRALNVPKDRFEDTSASILIGGYGDNQTRDEWKFNKFVQRLRNLYADLFLSILGTHLKLKGYVDILEWEKLKGKIEFLYQADIWMKEQQATAELSNKLGNLSSADPWVNKYYSREWVRRNILKFSDEDIAIENDLIKKDIEENPEILNVNMDQET